MLQYKIYIIVECLSSMPNPFNVWKEFSISEIVKCSCLQYLAKLTLYGCIFSRKQFALKFGFPLITFSLVNWFTSYLQTLLLRSRPFHLHVASWPWPSDDLDIQHCYLTICVKVLFFSYKLFIIWQIYFILTHNVVLVETLTLICHIVTFKS